MPHDRMAKLAGVPSSHVPHSYIDHSTQETARSGMPGMSENDMRKFMKEEQAEGIHPSLKGKHF